jgi:DNA-binding transcriptional MerR regulator
MNIAEVAEKYGLSTDTLRYYERIGLIPPVKRSKGGVRVYDETDLTWVEFAKCMKDSDTPIETIIEYAALIQQGESTRQTRKEILINQRSQIALRLESLQKTLDSLNDKIANYDTMVVECDMKMTRRKGK